MQNAAGRGDIDQPVQSPPSAAQSSLHGLGRRDGQWRHQHQRGKPDRNPGALENVPADFTPGEELIHADVVGEVQDPVEEGKQPQHPPELDQLVPAGQAPERRH